MGKEPIEQCISNSGNQREPTSVLRKQHKAQNSARFSQTVAQQFYQEEHILAEFMIQDRILVSKDPSANQ